MKGLLIAIEGIDGSGKQTVCKQLADDLTQKGIRNKIFSYPRYDQPTGKLIRSYLNDPSSNLSFQEKAYLYINDRKVDQEEIYNLTCQGFYVICDRYSGSSIAHNAGSPTGTHPDSRSKLFEWEHVVENHQLPDYTFVLDLDAEICFERLEKKENKDLRESDINYLITSKLSYRCLPDYYENVVYLNLNPNNKLLTPSDISKKIIEHISRK